jgi:hypothetical protein
MILVADGAGIIGVNFVVDWLAQQPDEAVNASSSIKPPTTGRQNSSAALPETTTTPCPQKTIKPTHWQRRSTSHD